MKIAIIISLAILLVALGTAAVAVFRHSAFVKHPIETSLRFLIAILAMIVGSLIVPEVSGEVGVSAQLAGLTITDGRLVISTGVPTLLTVLVVVATTFLIGVCITTLKSDRQRDPRAVQVQAVEPAVQK